MSAEALQQKHALIAPGQGNQEIGMGQTLAERSSAARAVWVESDTALHPHLGYSFSEFVWKGTIQELTKTENAQPAVIIDCLARKAALEEYDLLGSPAYFAGNSLGFLTALRSVGSLSMEAVVQLGIGRGEAFKYAIEHGQPTTMMALDTEPEIIEETRIRFNLEKCLINTDRQTMLGGPVEDIRQAFDFLKNERGVKRVMSFEGLVDAAFHSKYLTAAVPFYREVVYDIPIEAPKNGVLIGASGRAKQLRTVDGIRRELVNQLTQTENWRAAMRYLRRRGVVVMTELNSVPRLTNMNIEMFDPGKRPIRLAIPSLQEGDRGTTIAQRWQASWLEQQAA